MMTQSNEPAPQSGTTEPAATEPAAQPAAAGGGLGPGETTLTPPLQPCPCLGERCCYVDPDGVMRAAVITHIWNPEGLVSLTIFADGRPPAHVANVTHDESGATPDTWHWPARTEPAA